MLKYFYSDNIFICRSFLHRIQATSTTCSLFEETVADYCSWTDTSTTVDMETEAAYLIDSLIDSVTGSLTDRVRNIIIIDCIVTHANTQGIQIVSSMAYMDIP